jgi:phosphoribosylformimino-5-aminoimidazole carboxamide ribotide isomerase
MRLIPAIDLRGGRCVRLHQGDFQRPTDYDVAPASLLRRYAALGARWAHIVDLDGAADGRRANAALIAELARTSSLQLQVGGGIRSTHDIEALLSAGVARVVVGSAAVQRPEEVWTWLDRFRPERVCLAFDVRLVATGEPRVHIEGWQCDSTCSLWDALGRFPAGRLRHVLCTDIARDGTLAGPNLALYDAAVERYPGVAWQASGGIRSAADLRELARIGVTAAISGKALLEARIADEELRPFLHDASSPASTYAPVRS